MGVQTGAAIVERSMQGPQKIKNRTTIWPTYPTLGYSKEIQNINLKKYMHLYVHCSIIYNSQDMEATQVYLSISVGKKAVVHLHNGTIQP